MHAISPFHFPLLALILSFIACYACILLDNNRSLFEITFYRLSKSSDRVTARYELPSPITIERTAAPSIGAVLCLPQGHTLDRRNSRSKLNTTEAKHHVHITRVWCQNGTVPPDLLSRSNFSLVINVRRLEDGHSLEDSFYRATVVAHRPNQTILYLNLTVHDRLYQWMLSSQPVFAHWSRMGDKSFGFPNWQLSHRASNTSVNAINQPSDSQTHMDRNHVTTIMIYVLLAFFTLFVLTGILGLVGYLIQRLRHVHVKRRCSRHLVLATRKAMKKLPLRTLRPSDIEVCSGYDQCAVCIELYKASDVIRILPCRHFYHKKCIDPWLLERRSCPLCKLDILKSCGIMLGLSAEDENYLATRLVERDAHSASSSSSSSASVRHYPVGSRIKHLLTSLLRKQTDSRCDACSLAYLQVMQLGALRYGIQSPSASGPIFRTQEGNQTVEHSPVLAEQGELVSPPTELPCGSVERILSWIYSCFCFCCPGWPFRNESVAADDSCHPGAVPTRGGSVNATPFHFDEDITQALHTARLLCYRNSQSTDRLCYYHASVMGVPNLFRTPLEVHWTRYASHYATLRHHWNDARSRTIHCSKSTTHRAGWLQRFKSKRWSRASPRPIGISEKHPSLDTTPQEASSFLGLSDKNPSHCSPSEPVVLTIGDQSDRHSPVNPAVNVHQFSPTVANANGSNWDAVCKVDEYQRFSGLPPISVVGTLSSSSSDGSSEPSLVILPPSSIPGYISPLDRLWSPWFNSTAHIPPPPTYVESLTQSWCHATTGVGQDEPLTICDRSRCKIRSRKFRGGYHPYLFAGIGHQRAQTHRTTFKKWSTMNVGQCGKLNQARTWRNSFSNPAVRQQGLIYSLSRFFCPSRTRDTPPACSQFVPVEPVKVSPTSLNGPPPPYCRTSEIVPDNASSNTTCFRRVHPIPWPSANILCPLCRAEMRQVAHLLREYHQTGPIWRRMWRPHEPFKWNVVGGQSEYSSRKARHQHTQHQHHRHQGQSRCQPQILEHKLPSTLRTSVHVHSYDLCQPPSYRPSDAAVDVLQTAHSDSSESATTCRLHGVRVTVEPPEVQYHNGPLTSDSSGSPASSDQGEAGNNSECPVTVEQVGNQPLYCLS